jgi:hypothetical protein
MLLVAPAQVGAGGGLTNLPAVAASENPIFQYGSFLIKTFKCFFIILIKIFRNIKRFPRFNK